MISGYIICNFSSWMYQSGKQIWISALQMWGRCLLGKWVVNICNLFSHCLFIFGHPKILVDSISECITRCVTEVLTLLLGCSQASFCILLRAILPVPPATHGACCRSPSSWVQDAHHAPYMDSCPGWLWLPGCSLLVGSLALIFT